MGSYAPHPPLLPYPPLYTSRIGLLLRFLGWLLWWAGLLLILAIAGLGLSRLTAQDRAAPWLLLGLAGILSGYGIVLLSRAWERRATR